MGQGSRCDLEQRERRKKKKKGQGRFVSFYVKPRITIVTFPSDSELRGTVQWNFTILRSTAESWSLRVRLKNNIHGVDSVVDDSPIPAE